MFLAEYAVCFVDYVPSNVLENCVLTILASGFWEKLMMFLINSHGMEFRT